MKTLKFVFGIILLLLFVLIVDQSGIGFREHMRRVRDWAAGNVSRLKFNVAAVPPKGKD